MKNKLLLLILLVFSTFLFSQTSQELDKAMLSKDPKVIAEFIKKYPIEILDFRPIDEVISTAGGICFSELNKNLELKNHPNIYCAGEMLDWEAPTGGYLLQACFSIGVWIADDITQKLN